MDMTGTEILGERLVADSRAYDKMLRKLPDAVSAYLAQLRRDRPTATAEQLRSLVHQAFAIEPLIVGDLQSIKIETQPRDYRNDYDCLMSGYFAEATVPYAGARVHWRQCHTTNYTFGYRGKPGPSAVRLRVFLGDKNLAWIERDVEEELTRLRGMLASCANGQRLIAQRARRVVEAILVEAGMSSSRI